MCQDIQGDESGTSEFHPKKVDFRRKQFFELLELARDADVTVDSKADVRLLNKLSENRPHNGVVLEASPAPTPPLLSLGQFDPETSRIPLTIAEQSVEEKAVNGTPQFLRVRKESWRKPFVVMLDGILDPGNVGNIIRTCHFFGADAVVIATNTCANITSPTLIKASSGAYETLPIYLLPQPSNFLFESAKTGWKVYAAMPPDASTAPSPSERPKKATTSFEVASASPLLDDPCILVLGSEGTGLRANLQKRSEYFVSIERNVVENDISSLVGVDSVNVAVAAGILTQAFLNKPSGAADKVVPPKSHFTDNFLRTPGDEERHQAVMQALNDPVDGAVDPALEGADAMADPVLEDADSVVDPVPEEAGGVVDPAPEEADTVVDPVSEATDGEVDPTLEIAGDEAAVEQEVTDGKTKDVAH
jgi:21S rRNA (GM2251-2'-O)-methyltransferase